MILREYDSWILEIDGEQPTLGSSVIRFKRPGLKKLAALNRDEMQELEEVMRDFEGALQPEFFPDAVHYFLLGNRDPQ
ncbi:MAG: hypothetical protein LLG04_10875, partial [Parachlamydia sp.]|nr:hypothetical protein [Parachlamydia sp.]